MISLDLTRHASLVDRNKLHLVKGREVSICHHCKKSVLRKSLMRCNECRRDFCASCLDACRCYTQGGFSIGARRRREPRRFAVITGAVLQPSPQR
jgi:predicted sulfurtransferase